MRKTIGTALTLTTALAFAGSATAVARTAHPAKRHEGTHRTCKTTRRHHQRVTLCTNVLVHGKRHGKRPQAHATLAAPSFSRISQSATSAYSTTVSWPALPGATGARLFVNGHLLDSVSTATAGSYQIQGLWPNTPFNVSIVPVGVHGARMATLSRTIETAPRTTAFPRLYAADAFINTQVGASPSLDSNSGGMANEALAGYANTANLSNNNDWGIPVYTASAQSASYNVGCQYYWCDVGFGNVHIPAGAQPQTGSDGHMVVMQPDGNELDMWIGQHTSNGWTSGSRWLESATGPAANCTTQHACGGADAADFALAAGMVRPEEIAQGHIDHALAITTPDTRQGYIACPATNGDGKHPGANALPLGAHVQLDPRIDVSRLAIPQWQKVIAVALQKYGAYVIDTGGSVAVYAQSNLGRGYDAWGKAGVSNNSPSLSDLPWHSMRVLSMTQCGH